MKLSQRFWQVYREEEGTSLVYIALMLLVLLGFAGIAIDGSNAYLQRRRIQTAADAAALAGARAIALRQNATKITTEVNNMATSNGSTSVNWSYLNGNRGLQVQVNNTFNTFFARAVGVNSLNVASTAQAGYEPIVTTQRLFPLSTSCDCVKFQDVDMVPVVNNFCAVNQDVAGYHTWSLSLRDLDPLYHPDAANDPNGWYYGMVLHTGEMKEFTDGTARITGQITNPDGYGFNVNIQLSGRTSDIPLNSPNYPNYGTDTTNWYYYTGLSGTLVGIPGSRYDGAHLTLSARGPSFQVGLGASMWEAGEMGGSAGLTWTVVQQPTTGVLFSTDPGEGSLNLRLGDCNDDNSYNTSTTNECNFVWLDWNGGGSSSTELSKDVKDQTRSGTWSVSDWMPAGPDACDAGATVVQRELTKWLNKEVTIALYDNQIDQATADAHPGQYQICGFSRFILKGFNFSGNGHWLQGTFIPGVVRGTTNPNSNADYGVRDIRLYQ